MRVYYSGTMKPTEKKIERLVTHRSFEKAICHITGTQSQVLKIVREQAGIEHDKSLIVIFAAKKGQTGAESVGTGWIGQF